MMVKNEDFSVRLSFLAVFFISMSLSGCFSHWQGDSAKLVISFSGEDRVAYNPNDIATHKKLEHEVVLSNETEIQKFIFKGTTTLEASVEPGNWNVRVDSWVDPGKEIYATGLKKDVRLNLGQNYEIIHMYQAYLVTFDTNGGGGAVQQYIIVKAGESITLPNGSGLVKTGYDFEGWNTDAAGTEPSFAAGSTYTPEGSITLYAVYKDSNDPSGTVFTINRTITNNLSISKGGSVTLSIPENFDNYEWFIGGTKLATGKTVTLQANDPVFVQGYNWMTVVVSNGSGADVLSWSKEFVIYVNE